MTSFSCRPATWQWALAGLVAAFIAFARTGTLRAQPTETAAPLDQLTIYVVTHSHVDIGYTESQPAIEDKQVDNLLAGMAAARRTQDYPEGARYIYNVEGFWPADLLLRRLDAAQQAEFIDAVRRGQVAVNAMYTNTLTGLCRPEELIRLFEPAAKFRRATGVPLDTAMLSDVPACTWGTVPALAQAGVRYLSLAPNHKARLGGMHEQWDDKPFWWVGPSGKDRVLVWLPTWGYGLASTVRKLSTEWVESYVADLKRAGYRYDVTYIRWTGGGDNSVPDPSICEFVREWNAAHAWPRLRIASASEAFHALEQKYGSALPEVKGDMTPYWEDGAGSSARETAMSRANSERLAQAEALWALRSPGTYPSDEFARAMRLQLLYDEHSWGASTSVSAPLGRRALEQWSIKQSYAFAGDYVSRDLLSRAAALGHSGRPVAAVDILNPNGWTRSGVVVLPKHLATGAEAAKDEAGAPVPLQRLADGDVAMLVHAVPAFGARRFFLEKNPAPQAIPPVSVTGTNLDNGQVSVTVDSTSGNVVELRVRGTPSNLVDTTAGGSLNQYLYFNGSDSAAARSSGPVKIRIGEHGPLIGTLIIEGSAPGCNALRREVTLVAGEPDVAITDVVDKQRFAAPDYFHTLAGKESVNFAFPFHVPNGQIRLEVPFGIVRPDLDQIPGANKNWFTVNRWGDVSNADFGVTWVTLDAPLVEVGGLTANIVVAPGNLIRWREKVGPTQKLYAWVMNNHWNTNYPAFQEGPVTFRFRLRPHGPFDPAAAARYAIEACQPLLAVAAVGPSPAAESRLRFDAPEVIVTGLKPSDDGRALIVRVWNAADHPVKTRLDWSKPVPGKISLSDTTEAPGQPVPDGTLGLSASEVVTLRAELP